MTGQPQAAATIAAITRHAPARYGLHVIELGEDGGTLVVLGHHDDRRILAALNHYARNVWGTGLAAEWCYASADVLRDLQQVRALVVHACHRGWNTDEARPAADLEPVDPDGPTCRDCIQEVGANWALLYRDDVQDHPAAFPVTVWEYDA